MSANWKEKIHLQRKELAEQLRQPMADLAARCAPVWHDRAALEQVLIDGFETIPYCTFLYCLDPKGVQICDNVGKDGIVPGHMARDRTDRPYMKEAMPSWGFLLSDAYISLRERRPSLTALQLVYDGDELLGYLGADFNLRDLPFTSELYDEPGYWRQIKGDPAIRRQVFQQCRIESWFDKHIEQSLSIIEELMTDRGVFQASIHFSSSQATIWAMDDPYRYRILDQEIFSDPDICLLFPVQPYPMNAEIPKADIAAILGIMRDLRMSDPTFYLRNGSINIFNGMVSLTFSCDGTHYIPYTEFLLKGTDFWF